MMRWHMPWLTRSHSWRRSACTRGTATVEELGGAEAVDVRCRWINGKASAAGRAAAAAVVGSARTKP